MGAQKLLRGHDASASLRHPQMAPGPCRLHKKSAVGPKPFVLSVPRTGLPDNRAAAMLSK